MHKRKAVDLSVPFKYSGLANRATLEIIFCDASGTVENSSSSTVRIGFRFEDSHRIEWKGSSSLSIWDILESLSQDERISALLTPTSDGLVPAAIYLQNQIVGVSSLRETTLDSLGIRGSALFQLHRLPPEFVQKTPPLSPSTSEVITATGSNDPLVATEKSPVSHHSSTSESELKAETDQPTSTTYRSPQSESDSVLVPISSSDYACDPFTMEPFSIFGTTPSRSMFDPVEPKREKLEQPETIGQMVGISLDPDAEVPPSPSNVPEDNRDFKFPAETEGQDLTQTTQEPDDFEAVYSPCERETILYRRQTSTSPDTESDDSLPEEFFQLTETELHLIIADLRKEAGLDARLGERSFRIPASAKLIERYPRCIVRFIWSDDFTLQACFRPQENVSALYDFVKEHLASEDPSFQLYTTPPRVVLSNMNEPLYQTQIFPTAKVFMSTQNGHAKATDVLQADLLNNIQSSADASNVTSKWMSRSPRS